MSEKKREENSDIIQNYAENNRIFRDFYFLKKHQNQRMKDEYDQVPHRIINFEFDCEEDQEE